MIGMTKVKLDKNSMYENVLVEVIDRKRDSQLIFKIDNQACLKSVIDYHTHTDDYKDCDIRVISTIGWTSKKQREFIKQLTSAFEEAKKKRSVVTTEKKRTCPTDVIVGQTVYAYLMAGNHAAIVVRPCDEKHGADSLLKHVHSSEVRFKCSLTKTLRTLGTVKTKNEIAELCKKHLSKYKVIYNARYLK